MKLQPLLPDHTYHFFNRGNNKENLFREHTNYEYFLKLFAKHVLPIIDLYSYCLMPNHFHFIFRIKDVNELPSSVKLERLHQPFSNFFNAYSKAFNKMYSRTGSLFQKHPKRLLVKDEKYLKQLIIYVNTNPSHHGFGDYKQYKYSSFNDLISSKDGLVEHDIIKVYFDDINNFKMLLEKKRNQILGDEIEA